MIKTIAIVVLLAVLFAVCVFLALLAQEDNKHSQNQASSEKADKSEDGKMMLGDPLYGLEYRDPFSLYL